MERRLSGETGISQEEVVLERCCRQLVTLGKKQGGYITYESIAEALRVNRCEVSMGALDWVYERLTAAGIELVDQLPCGDVHGGLSASRRFVGQGLPRRQVVRRARRKYSRGRVEGDLDVGRQRCPEEAIDALLLRGESEPLLAEEVLNVAKECGLSQVETEQLFEYLVSKGIDLVGWQLSQALWSVSKEDGAMEDKERWGFFPDPGVQILLEDMRRFKRLTASEEFRLARLAEEGDQEASWRLIEGNLWRVLRTATRYVGMGLDFLDLFQEGCIGLIKAVSRFDWRSGNRFFTYGSWWVLQGIRTAITNDGRAIRLPAHTLEALRRLQMTTEPLCQVHEREPTTEEIACEMGLPVKKVREMQALAQPTLSLEAIMVGWEEAGAHSAWFLGEYGALPDDGDLSQSQLRETVATVLKELKPRQQEVLRLRFGLDGQEPQTLDQVARRFGLTRERIRQIESQALKKA